VKYYEYRRSIPVYSLIYSSLYATILSHLEVLPRLTYLVYSDSCVSSVSYWRLKTCVSILYSIRLPSGTPGSGWVLTSGFTFDITDTHDVAIWNRWARTEFGAEGRETGVFWYGCLPFVWWVVPIMVWNFQELCTGQNSFGYECSLIRRVILSFIIKEAVFRTHTLSNSSSESDVSTYSDCSCRSCS